MNNQDDLHDDLDPKLQKLYRQLPKEQPSKELDAKILAAAKMTTPKKSHHWQAPFALAASVVMVSSVALYLHEENPTAFEATLPATQAPAVEIAKPDVRNESDSIAHDKPLSDKKFVSQKTKDAPIAAPDEAQTASSNLSILAEKKAEIAHRAYQMAEQAFANKSAKSLQSADISKEQEAQQAKVETDTFAAAPAPAPIIAPAPRMQSNPEVAERRSWQEGRLHDANRVNGQLSAGFAESDQLAVLEKSNAEPKFAAAPMAAAPAPMNTNSLAGAAMPMAKHLAKRAEATDYNKENYTKNISIPVLGIEGIAIGMSREQLVAQGLTCYVDVCHLDLSQPKQETYWGMPAANAHLTAFLSHQVVTKLLLQQKNAQLNHVKTALTNVGVASQLSCIEEKGTLLIGRQLGANIFNVRSTGMGLSLAICQQTKSFNKP